MGEKSQNLYRVGEAIGVSKQYPYMILRRYNNPTGTLPSGRVLIRLAVHLGMGPREALEFFRSFMNREFIQIPVPPGYQEAIALLLLAMATETPGERVAQAIRQAMPEPIQEQLKEEHHA